jgi:hypothetical protein
MIESIDGSVCFLNWLFRKPNNNNYRPQQPTQSRKNQISLLDCRRTTPCYAGYTSNVEAFQYLPYMHRLMHHDGCVCACVTIRCISMMVRVKGYIKRTTIGHYTYSLFYRTVRYYGWCVCVCMCMCVYVYVCVCVCPMVHSQ